MNALSLAAAGLGIVAGGIAAAFRWQRRPVALTVEGLMRAVTLEQGKGRDS